MKEVFLLMIVVLTGITIGRDMGYTFQFTEEDRGSTLTGTGCAFISSKYNLNSIQTCNEKIIQINGKTASLIDISFGKPNDCISGCFYSTYCAIFDNKTDLPYGFSFYSSEEYILGNDNRDCREVDPALMTGRKHWLVNTDEFKNFLYDADRSKDFSSCRFFMNN